ncbi:MAG: DNA topoisomerase IV subunit A [Mycoplasmoidaceae bacterium]
MKNEFINLDSEDNIDNRSLDDIISNSFSKYAKYIIQDRALPDIRDGLKPVQRRILYAMGELGLSHKGSFKKSARTVGEVIGKYHPHGDSSIYEAMVRMSQSWKNNISLVEMHGNNGSIDGDSAAAMRYTETKLSQFGEEMLEGIKKNTVSFIKNFDDSETEPTVLPSLIPNILINGATGIAAGYATNIPPHNPNEVIEGMIYRIRNPNGSVDDLLKIIPGPDFPTAGIIQGKENIKEIYKTGRGKISIKSKMEQVELNSKFIQFRITEIPFDVNKANLVRAIDEIRVNNKLPGIKEVRDESNKDGILICIDVEKDRNIEAIKSYLFKNTQLQISYNANLIIIKDRKPVLMTLTGIFDAIITWANKVIINSSKFDLEKLLIRKEIIEGLLKALEKIDDLINLVKRSSSKEEAKSKIIQFFSVNENQAESIVSLRLYNLTNIDIEKLRKEHHEISLKIIDLNLIITNENHRNNFLIEILNNKKEIYSSIRKSKIENEIESYEFSHLDVVDVVTRSIIITKKGYIKFVNDFISNSRDLIGCKYSEEDIPIFFSSVLNTLQHLIVITSRGRSISIPSYKIKTTFAKMQLGIHINDFCTLDIDESIVFAFIADSKTINDYEILIASKNSLIKKFLTNDISISKNVKVQSCFKLKNDDKIIYCNFLNKKDNEIVSITNKGFYIRYLLDDIPTQGRSSSGVKNIKLKKDDFVSSVLTINNEERYIYLFSNKGYRKFLASEVIKSSRYNSGKRLISKDDEEIIFIAKIKENQLLNILSNKTYSQLQEEEIRLTNINANISSNRNILSVSITNDFFKNK